MFDAYELLLRTSQHIGYSQIRKGQPSHRSLTSGKSEGLIFTQQGGSGGRGRPGGRGAERGNENNQEEVAGQQNFARRSQMLLLPKIWTLLRPISKSDGGDLNTNGSLHETA